MKADMGKEKVRGFYTFEVILHDTQGEEVQVKTLDKEENSLGTEDHLQE